MLSDLPGPPVDLSQVPLSALFELARAYDESFLTRKRGELLAEFRRRRMSWRKIEEHTGWPHASARRWLKRYEALTA
jgi:hypothetical protein